MQACSQSFDLRWSQSENPLTIKNTQQWRKSILRFNKKFTSNSFFGSNCTLRLERNVEMEVFRMRMLASIPRNFFWLFIETELQLFLVFRLQDWIMTLTASAFFEISKFWFKFGQNEFWIKVRICQISVSKTVVKMKIDFKNDFKVFFKRRHRQQANPHWPPGLGLVLLLLLCTFQESKAACSCDSSVPACESPFNNPSTGQAGPNCPKAARPDCPCCFVCAGQLGESCSSSEPCDPALGLVCNDGKCQKGKQLKPFLVGSIFSTDLTYCMPN